MDYLLFLHSNRSWKLSLYVHSLGKLLPPTFVFHDYNYARWMSVYHYDMEMLQESNSSIFHKLKANGDFPVSDGVQSAWAT